MPRKWLIFGLLLLTVLAACQGPASQKKVRVAVVVPSSRNYGKAILNSVQLAMREANNKAGDVQVELVILDSTDPQVCPDDDPFAPAVELKLVERVVDDPEVVAWIGSYGSDQAKESMPILNRAGLAQITLSASWPGLTKPGYGPGEPGFYFPTGRRHFFRMGSADDMQGVVAARWAREMGYRKLYIVNDATTYSSGLAGIFQLTAQDLGMIIIGQDTYAGQSETDEKLQKIAAQVAASGADLLYFPASSSDEAPRLIRMVKSLKPALPIMAGDAVANQLVGDVPAEQLEGLMATDIAVVARDLKGEAARAFAARYKETYGEDLTSTLGTSAYEAMNVVLRAIAEAGKPTREGILEQLQGMEYTGIFGTWHFDENGDMTPAVIACLEVHGNAWVFLKVW